MSNQLPNCPTGCDVVRPIVKFSKCSPETNTAGIQRIFWTNPGNPLADWEDPAEWVARLDNDSTDADAIRTLHVIGSKPVPDYQDIVISLNRIVYGKKKHKVLLKIDETNDENYDMLRANECGTQVLFWYESSAFKLYGGDDGIVGSLKLDDVLVEDAGQLETFDGELNWQSRFSPERITSPIAA